MVSRKNLSLISAGLIIIICATIYLSQGKIQTIPNNKQKSRSSSNDKKILSIEQYIVGPGTRARFKIFSDHLEYVNMYREDEKTVRENLFPGEFDKLQQLYRDLEVEKYAGEYSLSQVERKKMEEEGWAMEGIFVEYTITLVDNTIINISCEYACPDSVELFEQQISAIDIAHNLYNKSK